MNKMISTRLVVYSAMMAAIYFTLNLFIAPIAYGPLQFRISNFLYPLALFNPLYAFGFGLGAFFTNLGSPFGAMDILVMPIVTVLAALAAWKLKKIPLLALVSQALIISIGVSFFPLWLGGSIPFMATFPSVLASNGIIVLSGWLMLWRPFYGKGIFESKHI